MSVIQTEGLTKHYRKQVAVDSVSFRVEPGQVFGFLGPNGSGKTTTIGMLLGIITPTTGRIRLFDEYGRSELHRARQRIGATLEYPNFYPYMSGYDNLRIVANLKRVGRARIDEVLELVGLRDRKKDTFKTYSLGMKQRLALAATMISDPELVILDEPANGLDPEGMREIREIISRLADRGKTIFLSSHLLWEVERTCTHVAIIKSGQIIRQASVDDIVAHTLVVELRAGDPDTLRDAVADYPPAGNVRLDDHTVIAELEDEDLAALNRFLGERGIWVEHLGRRAASLEDVFIELTGSDGHMSELAEGGGA